MEIALLGTGLLGHGFSRALLGKGHKVRVWNRTHAKARALEAYGAAACATPADAVQHIQRIHVVLKDDAAVDEVLSAAEPAVSKGSYIIDHSTTSVDGAITRTNQWKKKGISYVHAPVFMGPPNALDSTGVMLLSGNVDVATHVTPWLQEMTGKVLNFGEADGRAAGIKLMGNLFLLALTAGLSDMLGLGKTMGVPAADAEKLFAAWNPGAMVPARLARIISAQYNEPSWELQMARKDAGLMMQEAAKDNRDLLTVPGIAAAMSRLMEEGLGNKDWTVIAKENV